MARYIDADAFLEDFPELRDYEYASQEYEVDVVEVVRCKDCKYRDDDFCTGRGYPNALVPDDGFCDKGKRRE